MINVREIFKRIFTTAREKIPTRDEIVDLVKKVITWAATMADKHDIFLPNFEVTVGKVLGRVTWQRLPAERDIRDERVKIPDSRVSTFSQFNVVHQKDDQSLEWFCTLCKTQLGPEDPSGHACPGTTLNVPSKD